VQEESTHEVKVYWKRPNCYDNSGLPPSIVSNRQSGYKLNVPGSYEIRYHVSDMSYNVNENCSFRITLKGKRFLCPCDHILCYKVHLCQGVISIR